MEKLNKNLGSENTTSHTLEGGRLAALHRKDSLATGVAKGILRLPSRDNCFQLSIGYELYALSACYVRDQINRHCPKKNINDGKTHYPLCP